MKMVPLADVTPQCNIFYLLLRVLYYFILVFPPPPLSLFFFVPSGDLAIKRGQWNWIKILGMKVVRIILLSFLLHCTLNSNRIFTGEICVLWHSLGRLLAAQPHSMRASIQFNWRFIKVIEKIFSTKIWYLCGKCVLNTTIMLILLTISFSLYPFIVNGIP